MKIESVDQDTQKQACEIGKLEHECIHESLPGGYRDGINACFEDDDCKGSANRQAEIQWRTSMMLSMDEINPMRECTYEGDEPSGVSPTREGSCESDQTSGVSPIRKDSCEGDQTSGVGPTRECTGEGDKTSGISPMRVGTCEGDQTSGVAVAEAEHCFFCTIDKTERKLDETTQLNLAKKIRGWTKAVSRELFFQVFHMRQHPLIQ